MNSCAPGASVKRDPGFYVIGLCQKRRSVLVERIANKDVFRRKDWCKASVKRQVDG